MNHAILHLVHHLLALSYQLLLFCGQSYLVILSSRFSGGCWGHSASHALGGADWASLFDTHRVLTRSHCWTASVSHKHVLVWHHVCGCHAVHKVWMLAEPISIPFDVVSVLPLPHVLFLPLDGRVVRWCTLKSVENVSIVIGNLAHFNNPVRFIKWVVWVEGPGIRFWHLMTFLVGYTFWVLVINQQHLPQQDPILILNVTHSLYRQTT